MFVIKKIIYWDQVLFLMNICSNPNSKSGECKLYTLFPCTLDKMECRLYGNFLLSESFPGSENIEEKH